MQRAEVQLWTANPDEFGAEDCAGLAAALDAQEQARAGRLRQAADRRGFIVAHALRRLALGGLLGVPASSLRFAVDPHGRPLLAGRQAGSGLHFSLSRTRGFVALAATAAGPLGVDVEAERGEADPALLDPYLPQRPADAGFFTCWTAVEAYWKARGTGLSPANPPLRLVRAAGGLQARFAQSQDEASRLFITPLAAPRGISAALATAWQPVVQRRAPAWPLHVPAT